MKHRAASRLLPFLVLPALATPACVESDEADDELVDVETEAIPLIYAPAADGFAPADFDGDGKADASWRDGYWGTYYLDLDDDYYWDLYGTYPGSGHRFLVPADYDGDGRADVAIKDTAGVWNIDYAANGFTFTWDVSLGGYGAASLPVPADYDGDGRDDISVKDSTGRWYINYASNGFASGWDVSWGGYGPDSAVPVPADYDGDGRADLSVKDSYGYWHINYASNGFASGWDYSTGGYGGSTARPAPADYDGDGKADLSVKDGTGRWYINYSSNGFPAGWDTSYGGYGSTSFPIPADYDGDGRADFSVGHGGDFWLYDFHVNGYGAWDLRDRIRRVRDMDVELEDATSTSLRIRVEGDSQTEEIYWYGEWGDYEDTERLTAGKSDEFTFTGLTPSTEYCFHIEARNSEGGRLHSPCYSTRAAPAPVPTSGTDTVSLDRVIIYEGPIPYEGSWGPVTGAIATRLWREDDPWGPNFIWFVKAGYSSADCYGPDHSEATIPLIDGGSLDAEQIAEIQGIEYPPGNRYYFVACVSGYDQTPDTVRFNLDWVRP